MKAYPLKRNKNLAKDSTSAEDLLKLQKYKKYSKNTVLVYLQPTSPKRNFKHIDEAIKNLLKEKNR